jgi:hypothetical protein
MICPSVRGIDTAVGSSSIPNVEAGATSDVDGGQQLVSG